MHKITKLIHQKKAFSLIEILLVLTLVAIFGGSVFSLFFVNDFSIENQFDQEQARNFTQEGLEIIQNIKHQNFFLLADGDYGLTKTSNTYSLVPDYEEVIDSHYTRTIDIDPVLRNTSNQIDPGGTITDNLTKKITVTVSWVSQFGRDNSIVMQSYLTDWQGISWIQTTQTQFNAGTNNNTQILESDLSIPDNGKVELANTVENINYFNTINVSERASDIYFKNDVVYVAVSKASSGLCTADVSVPATPIDLDCLDIGGQGEAIAVNGNYAYLAASNPQNGFAIVDISDPSDLTLVANLDIGDQGTDIHLQGNHVYITASNSSKTLTIINVATPSSPFITSVIDNISNGTGILIKDNYAYLSNDDEELKIYNISNPNTPILESTLELEGAGYGSAIKDSYLYLSTSSSEEGLHVINIADPQNPLLVNTYDLGAHGQAVGIKGDTLFVTVDTTSAGVRLYHLNNPLSLIHLATVDIQGKGAGIYVNTSYAYVATDTQNQGVAIITTGDLQLEMSGDYTSQVHDTSQENVDHKSISWLSTTPPGTTLQFQIRTSDEADNIDDSTFVGPDGTASTYYTTGPVIIQLDPSRSGEQFIQWRAFYTSDGNATPSLEEVTTKYD